MTRSLVMPLLVIAVAVGAFLFVRDARTSASTSSDVPAAGAVANLFQAWSPI